MRFLRNVFIGLGALAALLSSSPSHAQQKELLLSSKAPTTFDNTKKAPGITLSGGNLIATSTVTIGSNGQTVLATVYKNAGKYYWEMTAGAAAGDNAVGMANTSISLSLFVGQDANGVGYLKDGRLVAGGSVKGTFAAWTSGSILSFAVDYNNRKIWFRVGSGGWNNDVIANQNPATNTGGAPFSSLGLTAGPYTAAVSPLTTGDSFTANFPGPYAETVPLGYGSLY